MRIAVANASEFHQIVSSNYTSTAVRVLASVSLENELNVARVIARQSESALALMQGGSSFEDYVEAVDNSTSSKMRTLLLARKAEKEILEVYAEMDKQVEKYVKNPPIVRQHAHIYKHHIYTCE